MHGYLNACVGERECARTAQGSAYRVNGQLRSVKQIRHITDFDDKLNSAMQFDREAAYGMRLNIMAGTAIRFEPGQERTVELVELSGDRVVYGFNQKVMGKLK